MRRRYQVHYRRVDVGVAEEPAAHRERHHAGLDRVMIDPDPLLTHRSGAIDRKERLGGLLTMYHQVAA